MLNPWNMRQKNNVGRTVGGRSENSTAVTRHSGELNSRASFTLIELLVVIAVIAVLAVVVVLTLNPAELLKQARDGNRLSDMDTLNKALSIFVVDSVGSGSLGSTSLTYLSLVDQSATTTAGTDCSSLGFPSGYFHCAASSTQRSVNGTGWIPVNFQSISTGSPISSLPVDPTNSSSTHLYYSYFPGSGSFKLSSAPESQKYASAAAQDSKMFQSGSNVALGGGSAWTLVSANSAFGTPNFWVMKYDAKCVTSGQSAGLTSPATAYQTYDNATTPCTSANSRNVASVADGYPIANISHTNAVAYCASIGAHLLTNDEYMTIVRDAEAVASNWTGGAVASGALFSGHNDNVPAYALPASADDTDGYSGTGNVSPSNQRRTFTLSNGSVVWDFAGNVWQHVARSVLNVGDLTTTMSLPACSDGLAAWGWCDFSTAAPYISAWSSDVAQAKVAPSDPSWYASQGMGRVYTYKNGVNQGTTVFLRGANWNNGSYAGAFALSLDWGTGSADSTVGFRCAR